MKQPAVALTVLDEVLWLTFNRVLKYFVIELFGENGLCIADIILNVLC
jgi:hypothetical protein